MRLTKERQKATGAFYTPPKFAELAVQYIHAALREKYYDDKVRLEDFYFWDMAAGEGALLDALPKGCECYATTLEYEDYEFLKDKNDYRSSCVDFLDFDINKLAWVKSVPKQKLIVFTNPPFTKLSSSNNSFAKKTYQNSDATQLFLWRIFEEINPLLVCTFSKMDIFSRSNKQVKRLIEEVDITGRVFKMFITNSKDWGLTGNFPISFSIFHGCCWYLFDELNQCLEWGSGKQKEGFRSFTADVVSDDPSDGKFHRVVFY